jgi:hypothetical protein
MNFVIEITESGLICISRFVKIVSDIEKLIRGQLCKRTDKNIQTES